MLALTALFFASKRGKGAKTQWAAAAATRDGAPIGQQLGMNPGLAAPGAHAKYSAAPPRTFDTYGNDAYQPGAGTYGDDTYGEGHALYGEGNALYAVPLDEGEGSGGASYLDVQSTNA